jgi:hypothetical protein
MADGSRFPKAGLVRYDKGAKVEVIIIEEVVHDIQIKSYLSG